MKTREIGFWTWLGRKVGGFLKELFCFGGWVLIPMLLQIYIMFYVLELSEVYYAVTILIWIIPAGITEAYQFYKEFEEDC